jgi:type I restriction enzyme M protein
LNNSNLQKVRDYFEGKAKILLITSIPQDVFVASGATVKPSLVFLKKFSLEEEQAYKNISEEIQNEISKEFDEQIKSKNTELKNSKNKDEKDKLKSEIKELEYKKEEKIKK